MIEIRFHGRGGQGAVTLAELMAQTAVGSGKHAQAFPSFGPERRGAPVMAFLRISDDRIRIREKVYYPDVVVVLDPTVMDVTRVDAGLKDSGLMIINTTASVADLRAKYGYKQKIATIDALHIALKELGVPITNTVMMGALAKACAVATPDDVREPLAKRFGPKLAPKNQAAFEAAYNLTKVEG